MTTPCPNCRGNRSPRQYLCRTCWFALTPAARAALKRTGPGAVQRLQALYDQIHAGTPLADIKIRE